jgi:hypothetical protein
MKIRPSLRRRHEPEQLHSTGRLEEKLPVRKRKETKKKPTQNTKAHIGLREEQHHRIFWEETTAPQP